MIAALLLAFSLQQDSAPQFADEVTVTATRTRARVAETASSAVVMNSEDLETTAAPTIDDALRQVPGFTLFRRSGSRTIGATPILTLGSPRFIRLGLRWARGDI